MNLLFDHFPLVDLGGSLKCDYEGFSCVHRDNVRESCPSTLISKALVKGQIRLTHFLVLPSDSGSNLTKRALYEMSPHLGARSALERLPLQSPFYVSVGVNEALRHVSHSPKQWRGLPRE